jgi:signal transduction histidine kinase/ActR/RegA family two-component response regulator
MIILEQDAVCALVLAPRGRDAALCAALLRDAGIPSTPCASLLALTRALNDDTYLAVVTEEELRFADLRLIGNWVQSQPTWSDLPFIVLTQRAGSEEDRTRDAERLNEVMRNVTLLERPFHPTTFVSMAKSVAKSRRRQYEARSRLEELHHLNESLEDRVAARTAELERAHALALEENAQRQYAEALLRQSQKMEIIGQLTGGVAHDFNNLLMAIMGNLDLLRRRFGQDEKAARLIEGALIGAKRGAALTQRLLAFARRQELNVEARNLVELVRGMTDLLMRSVGSQIELLLDLPVDAPPALVDANQIELALLNLVVNARDAMPDGGRIVVTIDAVKSAGAEDLPPGQYVRLIVNDTGYGMSEETLKRATEPFFSTKEVGKGTGLGLSMIHGLAQQLNGALRLTSVVDHGTRAELWLPVTGEALAPHAAKKTVTDAHVVPKMKVLVVDDDPLVAMSTVDMLEDLGHEVVECNSAEQALEVLRDQDIDLLVTDYSMPRMNGAQLAQTAQELRPRLSILVATGYAELPAGFELAVPRLGKPYQQQDLAAEIAKIVKNKRPDQMAT